MSQTAASKAFLFHTDLGAAVLTVTTVNNYDVEDVIKGRAVSQARSIQFLNQAKNLAPTTNAVRGRWILSTLLPERSYQSNG